MSRLTRCAPAAQLMLERAAQRGNNLGGLVSKLLELLDIYGADAMQAAVTEANDGERVSPGAVRVALEARTRASGRTPPRPVPIADARLRELSVAAADLSSYDRINDDKEA